MSNYRIVISYSSEKEAYIARAPELDPCEAESETRAEAVAQLEEEIAARLANMRSQGIEPPPPLDEQELDGELHVKVSTSLHRDLLFMARHEKLELEELLRELLARAVFRRPPAGRGRRQEGRGRSREGQGQRYHDIMENRADFIEYVRGLDSGKSPRRGGGGGRGRRGKR
jgi:predicted RNase H-like HicB family nuclease